MGRLTALAVIAVFVLSSCSDGRFGPWVRTDGSIIESSLLVEYQGFRDCDQLDVTFMRFFGNQYARDPDGVLGDVLAADGSDRVLEYEVLFGDDVLAGLEPQGFTHTARPIGSNVWVEREIYLDPAGREDYLYVVVDGEAIERWIRYEAVCER